MRNPALHPTTLATVATLVVVAAGISIGNFQARLIAEQRDGEIDTQQHGGEPGSDVQEGGTANERDDRDDRDDRKGDAAGDDGDHQFCVVADKEYRFGESFPAPDGCNTCRCGKDGGIACTKRLCRDELNPCAGMECLHGCRDGKCIEPERCGDHIVGDVWDAGDGCNSCTCTEWGVRCSQRPCGAPSGEKLCTSAADCPDGHVCTAEFGDCLSYCPSGTNEGCLDVCAGLCVRAGDDSPPELAPFPDRRTNFPFDSFPHRSGEQEYEDDVRTAEPENRFSDLDPGTPEGMAANALAREGVVGGFPDGEFKGDRPVNRAEAAKFILKARYGEIPDRENAGRFWDVLDGEWYAKYVMFAAEVGIIKGDPSGSFRPGDGVNTAELLKMFTIAFGISAEMPHEFTDVPDDAWFAPYAGIADRYGLFPERGANLEPSRKLTRREVVLAMYRMMEAMNDEQGGEVR